MELYVRFITTLAFGLIGMGAVLKVLLESLFNEWDAFNDIGSRISMACSGKGGLVEHIRAEDILLEAEKKSAFSGSTRIVDQRRRQIQELDEVETRMTRVYNPEPTTESGILPS